MPGPMNGPRGAVRRGGKPKDVKGTIIRLLRYLQGDKALLAVVFLCVILNTGASLAGSYMLRPIINTYIAPTDGPGDPVGLAMALVAMGAVYLVGVLASYVQARIMIQVSQKALMSLRDDLFCKMQKMPVRFFDTNSNGDLMSRYTNDLDAVGEMLNNTLVQLFAGIIQIIGTVSLMLYTNIWLTLITVVLTPLMIRAGGFVASRSRKYYHAQQEAIGKLNGYVEEIV